MGPASSGDFPSLDLNEASGLITDIYTVSTTCVSRTDSEKGEDFTADELFNFETVAKRDVFLSFYKSSEKRTRWFCGMLWH